ncbi:MAG: sensor histidine kinase [Thermodesulfobacteriota bacterium]
MRTFFSPDPAHPFQLVKFLSWSSLVLILGSSLFLTFTLGNYAKQAVLQKDRDFARLLAENLNHQIYQRFSLPTVLSFGKIKLRHKSQYERLDQVVHSTIHGFKVMELKIYDLDSTLTYSIGSEQVGQSFASIKAREYAKSRQVNFRVVKQDVPFWSFLTLNLPDKSYVLETTYPLRTEQSLALEHRGWVMGILRFTQDITGDYETITSFQWMIATVVLSSSLILFVLLYIIIRRADRLIAERIQEKERLERRLHENEKMASMGRMLAGISHEIRNPLGIIKSSAELLFKKAEQGQNYGPELPRAIFDESTRLSGTVNEFLDYARPKTPAFADVRLDELITMIMDFIKPELEKRQIAVHLHLPGEIWIQGDSDLIYRAVYNLLTNAMQAIGESGSISLSWSHQDRTLLIRDSGPGLDPSLKRKYIEPFYTTKDQGTGLGLAIVNNIVQAHGGSLDFCNPPEGGGAVAIRFP